MGTELTKLHTAITDLPFGGFADSNIPNALTTAELYSNQIDISGEALAASGVSDDERESLKIKVFDPAPRIADPYWDLARLDNNLELKEAFARENPANEILLREYEQEKELFTAIVDSYILTSGQEIDPQRLLVTKIVTELRSLQRQATQQPHILQETGEDTNKKPEVILKKKLLAQRIKALNSLQ